jgi:hypothetical protein
MIITRELRGELENLPLKGANIKMQRKVTLYEGIIVDQLTSEAIKFEELQRLR